MNSKNRVGRALSSKELMVGDWVVWGIKWNEFVNDNDLKNDFGIKDGDYIYDRKLIKIKGYEINDLEFNEKNDLSKRHYYAIGISAEILEKNGFVNEEKNIYVLREDPGEQFFVTDLGMGAWKILVRKLDGTVVSVIKEYVHELQQIMRLCGITKDIEL